MSEILLNAPLITEMFPNNFYKFNHFFKAIIFIIQASVLSQLSRNYLRKTRETEEMSLESDKKYFNTKLENQINVLLFFEKFNSSPVPLSYFKISLVPKKKMAMLSWSSNPLEDRPDIFQYFNDNKDKEFG